MHIFRKILIGLASFIFIVSVTGFVYLFTLQTTILDRTVVKGWLSESGLYDGRLIGALVQTTNAGGGQNGAPQPATDTLNASPEAIKTALKATFTPDFTQTQIEGAIDNAYSWIDGTSSEFTFSIPIDQKRDTLIAELAKTIEPQIAALPVCQSAQFTQNSVCRPQNMSVSQLASQLTTESIGQSDMFAKPLTNESFTGVDQAPTQQPGRISLAELPSVNNAVNILVVVLPIVALISLAIIILATASGQRLARSARLARRVFFGMLFICLPTALVVWLAKDNDFGLSNMFAAQVGVLVAPLIKTIGVGMLGQLALVSGIIGAGSAIAWTVLSMMQRNKPQPVAATPQFEQPAQPPINSYESPLEPSTDVEQFPPNYQK